MAIFFHGGCLPLLLSITVLLSLSSFPSSCSSSSLLSHQRHLLQFNSPQNIQTFFPTFSIPAFPSQTPPPTSSPPPLNPPTSPDLSPVPTPLPTTSPDLSPTPALLPTTSSSRAVAKAVAATAAGTLVFAGLFFFLLQRCAIARRRRHTMEKTTQVISSPRRDEEMAVSYDPIKLVNGTLKGLVVDENGLDVLYWRQLQGGGDGRRVFRKEVLDREPRREKRFSGGRAEGLERPSREKRDWRGRPGAVTHANSDPIMRIPSNSSSAASSKISLSEFQLPDLRSPPDRITAAVGAETSSTPKAENPPPPPPPPHTLVKETSDPPPAPPTPRKNNPAPPPPPPLPVKKNPAPPPPPPPPPKKNAVAPPPPPPPLPERKNPAPPPLPSRPGSSSLRPSSSKGRVGSIRSSGAGSKKVAEAIGSEVGPQQTKLKALHWDKLTANAEHSMVWDKIGNGSFQ